MTPYANRSGNSGVVAYEIRIDSVIVEFRTGIFVYDEQRPGRHHVQQMKQLAQAGMGLATYISQHVRENYAKRLR